MSTIQMRSMNVVLPGTTNHSRVTAPPLSAPVKSVQRPPCAEVPDSWDLDSGTPDAWQSAVHTCYGCPLFEQCKRLAQTLIERGDAPRAMIWAGVAYDNSGNVIENLDRHRTAPIDHKRPMRIIRNGPRPTAHGTAVSGAPKRHIVLGRPLRPTGTDAV
ncbi:hypothetical protein [Nocardia sp. NPDC019395]|uniref:hypothetical protein n=1 Tax=Nocardia sp. NPDC019395 TaxID=3154686 RepID=UPI0033E2CB68